jgi:hypothetical protein
MVDDNAPETVPVNRTNKIKSTLDNRKSRADRLFLNANSKLAGEPSNQDDLRTVLNRIRKGISTESVQESQEDEQPA